MSENLNAANKLFEDGKTEDSLVMAQKIFDAEPENPEVLMLLAKISYQKQEWGNALNYLNKILDIDPGHILAANYKKMIVNILTYWNKDSFNP